MWLVQDNIRRVSRRLRVYFWLRLVGFDVLVLANLFVFAHLRATWLAEGRSRSPLDPDPSTQLESALIPFFIIVPLASVGLGAVSSWWLLALQRSLRVEPPLPDGGASLARLAALQLAATCWAAPLSVVAWMAVLFDVLAPLAVAALVPSWLAASLAFYWLLVRIRRLGEQADSLDCSTSDDDEEMQHLADRFDDSDQTDVAQLTNVQQLNQSDNQLDEQTTD